MEIIESVNNKIKLNLGCGAVRPKGWINTDSSLNSLIQNIPLLGKSLASAFSDTVYVGKSQYMNLNKRWNFKNDSIDIIYASHLFEHLSPLNATLFLFESYRTLKKNGIIRLVVPDLYQHTKHYIELFDVEKEKGSHHLLSMLNLHREGQYNSTTHNLVGWLQDFPHQHKYMYDKHSLTNILSASGFSKILESSYGISKYIKEISEVENIKYSGYEKSLYIEAVKG